MQVVVRILLQSSSINLQFERKYQKPQTTKSKCFQRDIETLLMTTYHKPLLQNWLKIGARIFTDHHPGRKRQPCLLPVLHVNLTGISCTVSCTCQVLQQAPPSSEVFLLLVNQTVSDCTNQAEVTIIWWYNDAHSSIISKSLSHTCAMRLGLGMEARFQPPWGHEITEKKELKRRGSPVYVIGIRPPVVWNHLCAGSNISKTIRKGFASVETWAPVRMSHDGICFIAFFEHVFELQMLCRQKFLWFGNNVVWAKSPFPCRWLKLLDPQKHTIVRQRM